MMEAKPINEIMEALKNHEMQVYYQPQYDTLTNALRGAEALVRWFKPDGTMVMPGQFIPVLEESEAILELDWYMVEAVCVFLQKQQTTQMKQVPISINFSRWHVQEEKFVEKLCDIVNRYDIPHRLIVVEITESVLVERSEQIIKLVDEVRSAGFCVAIDDFGSGLSSLSFVKDISLDVLKIDRSMISRNCEDEKERIVLESIFMLAQRLKWTTVAEGVETREQLGFLRTCGCDVIQGFLFARPMPEKDFEAICRDNPLTKETEDILLTQAPSTALNLLMEAVFTCFPLVILSNLTRNSYYMMAYENFSTTSCASTGVYDELILHGSTTMHPEDQELFRTTFDIGRQIAAYERGEKTVRVITRQLGDDGVYRRVETTNYFVKNNSVDDILVITLCKNLD